MSASGGWPLPNHIVHCGSQPFAVDRPPYGLDSPLEVHDGPSS
jgi:hypothetical protein